MLKRLLAMAVFMSLLGMPVLSQSAQAYSPLDAACSSSGGVANGAPACANTSGTELFGPDGTFIKVSKVIAIVAGIAAVILIIISGIQFITSAGDPQKTTTARKTIIYALIGLIVIVLAQSIITYIVSRIAQ